MGVGVGSSVFVGVLLGMEVGVLVGMNVGVWDGGTAVFVGGIVGDGVLVL